MTGKQEDKIIALLEQISKYLRRLNRQ